MSYGNDARVTAILDNLSSLIVSHGGMLAAEYYAPSKTDDDSDEYIRAREEWIRELRAIRERFENLVAGVAPKP